MNAVTFPCNWFFAQIIMLQIHVTLFPAAETVELTKKPELHGTPKSGEDTSVLFPYVCRPLHTQFPLVTSSSRIQLPGRGICVCSVCVFVYVCEKTIRVLKWNTKNRFLWTHNIHLQHVHIGTLDIHNKDLDQIGLAGFHIVRQIFETCFSHT